MDRIKIGFDIGGTYIKTCLFDERGNCNIQLKTSTQKLLKQNTLAEGLFKIIKRLCPKKFDIEIEGIGIAVPGIVDTERGIVKFAGNLKLKDYKLKEELKKLTGIDKIVVQNDAYVATLAEFKEGEAKNFNSSVMLMIGTGIGSGIVIDGKVLETSSEAGHMKTRSSLKCTCGEHGCLETIASTRALVRHVKSKIKEHDESGLWIGAKDEKISGETVFNHLDNEIVKNIFDNFIRNLGDGIVTLVNVFQPEAVIIGGAIAEQKEKLTQPLERYVNEHIFSKNANLFVKVLPSRLSNPGLDGLKYLIL